MIHARAIDHIVINVRDALASAIWYEQVLGMTREEHVPAPGQGTRISMVFGDQKINLRPIAVNQQDRFTGRHPAAGSADLCFLVNAEPDAVAAHLAAHNVTPELGPVDKRGARGPIRSVYSRDPDGNLIELSTYAMPRLATYGTLAPGQPNASVLSGLEGRWLQGTVRGRLEQDGWGAAMGYPGFIPDQDAGDIRVDLFESEDLTAHWSLIDDFEGAGYRRIAITVMTNEGPLVAEIYALADAASPG